MRDVLTEVLEPWREGSSMALATVVSAWRSAPRAPGAAMAVGADGAVVGSVSGGCVESAVYELAERTLMGAGPSLQCFGMSDSEAGEIGLTCGGTIEVFVERIDQETFPLLDILEAEIEAGRPVAVATVIECVDPRRVGRHRLVLPDRSLGSLGDSRADAAVDAEAKVLLEAGRPGTIDSVSSRDLLDRGTRVFVNTHLPPPRMLIFGSNDFAAALATMGSFLGYHVTVCDARRVFTTAARFPAADQVVTDWPHRYLEAQADGGMLDRRTVIAVLTHDPKFDVPVLEVALRMPELAYVGAMGSRLTHEDRLERLRAAGVRDDELGRLSSPIGLDLGARTPAETAVSIAAEIIAITEGGAGGRLAETSGPIHRVLQA